MPSAFTCVDANLNLNAREGEGSHGGRLFGPPTRTQGYSWTEGALLKLRHSLRPARDPQQARRHGSKVAIFLHLRRPNCRTRSRRPIIVLCRKPHVETRTSTTAVVDGLDEASLGSATRARARKSRQLSSCEGEVER